MHDAPAILGRAMGLGQLISLIVATLASAWYVIPWLKRRSRADALVPLLWVQVFRYIALQIYSSQYGGYPISDEALHHILYGDLAGAGLALLAIAALRRRSALGIGLTWLLAAETVIDVAVNVMNGRREHLFGLAHDVGWLVVTFYVPVLLVSTVLVVWQLVSRNREPLGTRVVA